MTPLHLFDFARVASAVALLFFIVPVIARRLGDRAVHPWYHDIAPSFLYASTFFAISGNILANWRLCYGGSTAVLIVGWIFATVAFASHRRWIWDPGAWRRGFLGTLQWFERGEWRRVRDRLRSSQAVFDLTAIAILFCFVFGIVFVNRTGFAIENYRFLGAHSYDRAVSLQTLMNGDPWMPDGPAALLAPAAHLSGADAATVVRFAGPIFLSLLVLAGAYCAWVHTGRLSAAFIASILLAIYPAVLGFDSPGEPAGPEYAALYWILALAMTRVSWTYAAAAAGTALLVHGEFTAMLAGTLICVSAAVVLAVGTSRVPRFLATAAGTVSVAIVAFLLLPATGSKAAAAGPYEYETAARTAARIARDYPHNKWMIISPAQELSYTYGRGWHLQISEFVRSYTPERVADPSFRFDYTVDHAFVFIEKEPLPQAARGPAMAGDEYAYVYLTQSGRMTLEFQAAKLMAAYASSHKDAVVYEEDDRLIVYRVTPVPRSKTL